MNIEDCAKEHLQTERNNLRYLIIIVYKIQLFLNIVQI